MEEKLTPEMKEVIAKLGELVKADERCMIIQSTISDYEHSEELTALIGEYNTQQNLLADAYNKPEGDRTASEEFKSAVQARIDALYDQITTHPLRRRMSLTRSHRRFTRSFSSLSQANVPAHTTAHPAAAPAAVIKSGRDSIL